jgi:ABC-type glycerol-3-phosphate transport system permease component
MLRHLPRLLPLIFLCAYAPALAGIFVALASLSRKRVRDSELMMAGSVVTVPPVLLLSLALQKHYIQGLLLGSVKG